MYVKILGFSESFSFDLVTELLLWKDRETLTRQTFLNSRFEIEN